jgi:hypothetical protein
MSIVPQRIPSHNVSRNGANGHQDDGPVDGWLARPTHGWGLIVIKGNIYSLKEVEYDEEDGRRRMLVQLRTVHDDEYQLTPDADGVLHCDCADACFRDR